MVQASVYEEAAMTSQDNALQCGEDQTPLVDVSSTLDVAKDGDAVPPSSIPVGQAGPVTCHLDLSFTAPSPVLAGPHALAGVASVPPPPSAPSEDYLRRSGRLPPDSATSVPQPAAVVPFSLLVTLSSALPRPFLTLVVAQTGLWRPSFQPAQVAPCPASSQSWSFCNDLPELHGFPAGPLPSQMTPGPAAKNPFSYPPALGSIFRQDWQWKPIVRFFARTGSEKTLCPTPGAWFDFSPATSRFPGTFSGIYQHSAPARSGFWTPGTSTPGVSYLISCSFLCISPDDCHSLPGCSVDAPDHAGSSGLHAGLARRFLPIHEEQDDGYVGCCSTPAIYGSRCSTADYGPWWAAAAESLWLLALPWARHKSGSKRADVSSRPRSPSVDRSQSTKTDGLADGSPVVLCRLSRRQLAQSWSHTPLCLANVYWQSS